MAEAPVEVVVVEWAVFQMMGWWMMVPVEMMVYWMSLLHLLEEQDLVTDAYHRLEKK